MITETTWLILIIWFVTMIIGFKFNKFFLTLSGVIGIFFSLSLMIASDALMVVIGAFLIIANIYLCYHSLFKMIDSGGKK